MTQQDFDKLKNSTMELVISNILGREITVDDMNDFEMEVHEKHPNMELFKYKGEIIGVGITYEDMRHEKIDYRFDYNIKSFA